jgi:hypothetical protein
MSQNLDPTVDFEPDTVPFKSLNAVQNDARWVEKDILNYDLSTSEPYTFTLLYSVPCPAAQVSLPPVHGLPTIPSPPT